MANEVIVGDDGHVTYYVDGTLVSRTAYELAGGVIGSDALDQIEINEFFAEQTIAENQDAVARKHNEAVAKAEREAGNSYAIEFSDDGLSQTYYLNGSQVSRVEFEAAGGNAGDLSIDELEARDEQDALDTEAFEQEQAEEEARLAEEAYQKKVAAAEELALKENDWRVRLHLAPEADYLYKAKDPGILAPLNATDGIIFPYTPEIAVQYNANYENYDLTHSNYRGYFYTGSIVQNLLVTATFTANDVAEANYMLAAMHFLRSATKMFYGQDDSNRGMPPPVVFLTGLGEYQFNNHPCAITMMNYNLPNDVDYIPCGKPEGVAPVIPARVPLNATSSDRLKAGNLSKGAKPTPPLNSAATQGLEDPYTKATYVPTKISIAFTMIPIQTRDQVSKEFSLEKYASGDLLRKGFW